MALSRPGNPVEHARYAISDTITPTQIRERVRFFHVPDDSTPLARYIRALEESIRTTSTAAPLTSDSGLSNTDRLLAAVLERLGPAAPPDAVATLAPVNGEAVMAAIEAFGGEEGVQMARIANDPTLSADQKMRGIYNLDHRTLALSVGA